MGKDRKPTHLRAWRLRRGLTIEAAADAIGSTGATLSRIERGLQPYSQDILENLALLYECTPADLLGVHPASPARNIFSLFDRVSVREQQRLYRAVEGFLSDGDAEAKG